MTTNSDTKSFANTPQRCISAKEKVEQPKNLVSVEDELKENEATMEGGPFQVVLQVTIVGNNFGMVPVRDDGSGPAELNHASLECERKLTDEQAQSESGGIYMPDQYGTNQGKIHHGQGSWTMQCSKVMT